MQVVHERCCGLDVHKKNVVACVLTNEGKRVRTFGTVTKELLRLLDWLQGERITHLAMESTGVYWRPLYNLLEGHGIELMVVNPAHMKAVPGRKTDVKDAEWIADLLRHGLLRGSRIPERPQRELQEAVRYRRTLIDMRADEVRRLQKVLEGGNIKLGDVATDVMGLSGRDMLRALVEGEDDSARLAEFARGRLRRKRDQLQSALKGSIGQHQRFMLVTCSITSNLWSGRSSNSVPRSRPGCALMRRTWRACSESRASVGVASRRSWPKSEWRCATGPPTKPSRHGRRSARATTSREANDAQPPSCRGNQSLRGALVEATLAAIRVKDSYFSALYHRVATRRGAKRAIIAVAHAILIVIYHMLKDGTVYSELGGDYFERVDREAILRRSVRRIEKLGYQVTLHEASAA